MKISNSKKQLAGIIHENGGWRDGMSFSWYGNKTGKGYFGELRPRFDKVSGSMIAYGGLGAGFVPFECTKLPNWHQTILSREEYFHLYPVAEAAPEPVVEAKPTIEQLAADYRNAKDYANRKQREVDDAKADAEVKLAALVAAGKALGLVLSVTDTGPELVITDWRDLIVGDRIWVGDSGRGRNCPEGEYEVAVIDSRDSDQPLGLAWPGGLGGVTWPQIHKRGWRFISRPAKGGADA